MRQSREAELVEIINEGIGKVARGTATSADMVVLQDAQRERVERMRPAPFRSRAENVAARHFRQRLNTANY